VDVRPARRARQTNTWEERHVKGPRAKHSAALLAIPGKTGSGTKRRIKGAVRGKQGAAGKKITGC